MKPQRSSCKVLVVVFVCLFVYSLHFIETLKYHTFSAKTQLNSFACLLHFRENKSSEQVGGSHLQTMIYSETVSQKSFKEHPSNRNPYAHHYLDVAYNLTSEHDLCLFFLLRIWGNHTEGFRTASVQWMQHSALFSIERAMEHSIKSGKLPMKNVNESILILADSNYMNYIPRGRHVVADIGNETWIKQFLNDTVTNLQCSTVAITRLDTDDFISVKYFEVLHQPLSHFFHSDRLAAVIGASELSSIHMGFGCCERYTSYLWPKTFSIGQTYVVQTDIWRKLGIRTIFGMHTKVHQYLTNDIRRLPELTNISRRIPRNSSYNVKIIHENDVVIAYDVKGIGSYFITPLSGHFPWMQMIKMEPCEHFSASQRAQVFEDDNESSAIFWHAMSYSPILRYTDACNSNLFFKGIHMKSDGLENSTCEDVERKHVGTFRQGCRRR